MKILSTLLVSVLLSIFSTPAYADVHVSEGGSNVHVSVNTSGNSESSYTSTNNITSNTNIHISEDTGDSSVQVNNGEFTITGTVKSISGSTLNVSGQNIQFDFGKLTTPSTGQKVTVKGDVKSDGTMVATSISGGDNSNSVLGTSTTMPHASIIPPSIKPIPSISPLPSIQHLPILPTLKPFSIFEQLRNIFNQLFSVFKGK